MDKHNSDAVHIKNLEFTYANMEVSSIREINLALERGSFTCICGPSGCGKTTLLRNLKPSITPHGLRSGTIEIMGKSVESFEGNPCEEAQTIGYVLQNPENQIVTDKVWHELAFGLENLGLPTETIRLRIAEIASFFGIQSWFDKDVSELSGGQKQLLNLAAVMVMQPEILILDEPTSQLDPIAAVDFLDAVKKINNDIGTTVIITEHRLDNVVSISDRLVVMDNGEIIVNREPYSAVSRLADVGHPMFLAMPNPAQAYNSAMSQLTECDSEYFDDRTKYPQMPLNVREGRQWLDHIMAGVPIKFDRVQRKETINSSEIKLHTKDLWFRYERDSKDIIKGLDFEAYKGEILAIIGGNGTGKTTLLSILAGMRKPYRGKCQINGDTTALLPQNPQTLFVRDTVREELLEALEDLDIKATDSELKIAAISELLEIADIMDKHPYDISGGEQQRVALGKVLLLNPDLLLMDEPTKGIDNLLKNKLGELLRKLSAEGKTIIFVSHDIEFCSRFASRCMMFFDGGISGEGTPANLFAGNNFYTTAANRMARNYFVDAILPEEVGLLVAQNIKGASIISDLEVNDKPNDEHKGDNGSKQDEKSRDNEDDEEDDENGVDEKFENSGNDISERTREVGAPKGGDLKDIKQSRNFWLTLATAAVMGVTIFAGSVLGGDRVYYVISALVAIYSLVPFFVGFERSKPQIRELVVISVLIAIGVIGRQAFFMLPQMKPVIAISVIAGASLGPGAGFLVGAMIAFVSNFFFGQGPWTPWQMMALGLAGMFAGLIFQKWNRREPKPSKVHKIAVCVFGLVSGYFYGLIVDLWTLFGYTERPSLNAYLVVKSTAIWFDTLLAISTFVFLWVLYAPMIKKLNRIKLKYGMD
ncbi:hypothetical protein HMPREF1635_01305 [Clostridiales bacterium S5-A14a]|nr:hypothetical protein HMPREF1635_01305 [Clostridiales bacterium S5-A14a]